jgi:hypothetical protein
MISYYTYTNSSLGEKNDYYLKLMYADNITPLMPNPLAYAV